MIRRAPADRARRRRGPGRRRVAGVALVPSALLSSIVLLAACTSVLDRPALPAGGAPGTGATSVTTSVSITPVTPDGLLTGPGVTDATIALAVLVTPGADRGFDAGVRLWQRAVNTGGGLCGRTITLVESGVDGVPDDPAAAYRQVGASVLGLLMPSLATGSGDSSASPSAASSPAARTGSSAATTAASTEESTGTSGASTESSSGVGIGVSVAADQIPTVTATGTSAQLGPSGPLVAGATADILTINGLQHLLTAGLVAAGDTVGVLDDGSAPAADALAGARWWAGERGLDLDVRGSDTDPATWSGDRLVLAPVGAGPVADLLAGAPADVAVLTLPDGFDPAWPEDTIRAAGGRLYVVTPTPAYGSDYPSAVAVASMAAAGGSTQPGPRTLDGYAVGTTWGRLITRACSDRTLTRSGVRQAVTTIGPAPATSLFGASDPGLVVQSALPATRSSSISVADAAAATGLRSLAGLESAPGIDDYSP